MDPDLFSATGNAGNDSLDMIRALFRETESDLVHIFERGDVAEMLEDEGPIVMRFSIRGTPAEIKAMRAKLEEWLQDCSNLCGERHDADEMESWSGLLAFYPQQAD